MSRGRILICTLLCIKEQRHSDIYNMTIISIKRNYNYNIFIDRDKSKSRFRNQIQILDIWLLFLLFLTFCLCKKIYNNLQALLAGSSTTIFLGLRREKSRSISNQKDMQKLQSIISIQSFCVSIIWTNKSGRRFWKNLVIISRVLKSEELDDLQIL